jgi:chondroitin 4-sulfotransferase 11
MIISYGTRSIFIHIQKTGGTSIEHVLQAVDSTATPFLGMQTRHPLAKHVRHLVEPEVWSSYRKFAFVRNPWDRLVSWHRMCLRPDGNGFQRYVREHYADFSEFIRDGERDELRRTCVNQLDYVTDDAGKTLVDFIGRFESLAADFDRLGLRGTVGRLRHLNRTEHADYRGYYTDETRDIVARRFAADCEAFGYRFE